MKRFFLILVIAIVCLSLASCNTREVTADINITVETGVFECANDGLALRIVQVYSGKSGNLVYSHSNIHIYPLNLDFEPPLKVYIGRKEFSEFYPAGAGRLSGIVTYTGESEVTVSSSVITANLSPEEVLKIDVNRTLSVLKSEFGDAFSDSAEIKIYYLFEYETFIFASIKNPNGRQSSVLLSTDYEVKAKI